MRLPIDPHVLFKHLSDAFDVLKKVKEIVATVSVAIGWLFRQGVPAAIQVTAVNTTHKHDDMWRWDNRTFRFRHPHLWQNFDLVGLELGRDWWFRYPEQDWILVDWRGRQIAQYSLCPLKEQPFRDLLSGHRIESELAPDDVEPASDIHAHMYWYLANFMVARRRPRIPESMSLLAKNLLITHAAKRALQLKHFGTNQDRDIVVITIVEAPSIRKFARAQGFTPTHPHSSDIQLSKIYYRRYDRSQLKAILRASSRCLQRRKLLSIWYRVLRRELFLQPPTY